MSGLAVGAVAEVAVARRYTTVAIVLHWLIALVILGQLTLALVMTRLPHSEAALRNPMVQLHKSIGITILALSLLRLFWRLGHTPPPAPPGQPAWERIAARANHIAFYAFMIGMPLLGWASSALGGHPVVLYGLLHMPSMSGLAHLPNHRALSETANNAHVIAGYTLIGLVALHIAAALKHQFVNRDIVLWRMLPLWRRRPDGAR